MTNREFFIETLKSEAPKFLKAIKAVPADKLEWKPNDVARTTGRVVYQLACQPVFILGIIKDGAPDWGEYAKSKGNPTFPEMIKLAEKKYAELEKAMEKFSDADWENGRAVLAFGHGKWEAKKYDMAWGFLFDAIHHRGQLTTYLRAMGAKVPAIYGGSADEKPSA